MNTPPRTRSASKPDDIIVEISKKIEELKIEVKAEIASEINKLIDSQQELITKLNNTVIQQESTIAVLQKSVEKLKKDNENLRASASNLDKKINSLEQYGQRQSIRIHGIEVPGKNERDTPDQLIKNVHKMMSDVGVNAPIHVIDRAHRIGPRYERYGDKKMCQAVIVKFNNFSIRTDFYRKRRKLDKKYKLRIDLTKENYSLLKDAMQCIYDDSLTKEVDDVYVFADINCRIKIVDSSREEEQFVESIDDVKNFLAH